MHPDPAIVISLLVRAFDLAGTFVFAISGAIAGARHRLDLYGVLVLSVVSATFGGITRDVLIGAVPPASVEDWKYAGVSVLAGFCTFFWYSTIGRFRNAVLILDAAGLGLFAVSGAGKALAYDLGPVPAALMGMLTGIGGGIVRDVLVSEVPCVFRTDIYALAALLGAGIFVSGQALHLPSGVSATAGAVICFGIRMVAIRRGWQFPVAKPPASGE